MYDEREFDERAHPTELTSLEQQLASLAPAAPGIDRDRLMFAAGRASVGGAVGPAWASLKFWPAATAIATAASLLLTTMLVWQRAGDDGFAGPQVAEVAEIEPMVAQGNLWRWSDRLPNGYLGVRQVALTRGIGAVELTLPAAGEDEINESPPPATARQLLKEMLPHSAHFSS